MSDASYPEHSTATGEVPWTQANHQADRTHVGWVLGVGGGLALMLVLCFLFAHGLLAAYQRPGGGRRPVPEVSAMGRASAWLHPGADLQRTRAAAEGRLRGYGWVDQKRGVVRIPIDRAMKLVVRREPPRGRHKAKNPHAASHGQDVMKEAP